MLKTTGYDIVFQEIPGETTLAINLSNCPFRCPGCHSPYLQEDVGTPLTEELLFSFIEKYADEITCIAFMGGDSDATGLYGYVKLIKEKYPNLKTAWYSGRISEIGVEKILNYLDFIKLGPYREELGSLKSKTTNQRLYRIKNNKLENITSIFWT